MKNILMILLCILCSCTNNPLNGTKWEYIDHDYTGIIKTIQLKNNEYECITYYTSNATDTIWGIYYINGDHVHFVEENTTGILRNDSLLFGEYLVYKKVK